MATRASDPFADANEWKGSSGVGDAEKDGTETESLKERLKRSEDTKIEAANQIDDSLLSLMQFRTSYNLEIGASTALTADALRIENNDHSLKLEAESHNESAVLLEETEHCRALKEGRRESENKIIDGIYEKLARVAVLLREHS